jgi:hypothetical protein
MSNVVIYNPSDPVVVNRVTSYLLSVNTPDYNSNPNALINPDLSEIINISPIFWKFNNNTIVAMSSDEQILINNFIKSKSIRSKKFLVRTYNNLILQSETWYENEPNPGIYENIVEQSIYNYNNDVLISKVTTSYYYDGTITNIITENYFSIENTHIITKIS